MADGFSAAVQYTLLFLVGGAPGTLLPYVGVWWLGQVVKYSMLLSDVI